MLKRLYIENIAIIEKIEVDFMPGLCVLSGETGAGKSIIIDSISALCGGRASRDIIRTGSNSAVVSAIFEDLNDKVVNYIKNLGIDVFDGTLLIRREMFLSGHNSCHINGQPATLQMLKLVGNMLINIHGQHDGLNLLNDDLHIDYLDSFCNLESLLAEYSGKYDSLLQLNRKIKALSLSESEKNKRLKEIEKQIDMLETANISENEWDILTDRRSRLYSEEKTAGLLYNCLKNLEGSEETQGAYSQIASASDSLKKTKVRDCEDVLYNKLSDAIICIEEVTAKISDMLSRLEYSPELLDETESRLQELDKLSVYCNCEPNELDKWLKSLYDEQSSLLSVNDNIDNLKIQYSSERSILNSIACKLHEQRCIGAEELSKRIESDLAFLNMPNAKFNIEIESISKFGKKGTDCVRFMLSANRGEDLKPLSKVASGGELSRIMLCFKNVLNDSDGCSTAIFDEIDTGVSGKAASRVAQMLYSIGRNRQVLCVTHLPQIASIANYQYRISKSTVENRTVTSVELLDYEGRIEDLCRLIGGENINQLTRESAAEMLQEFKN